MQEMFSITWTVTTLLKCTCKQVIKLSLILSQVDFLATKSKLLPLVWIERKELTVVCSVIFQGIYQEIKSKPLEGFG